MHSLFYVLTDQHGDDFAPVRCNEQTVGRLFRYFEDVVTDNKLPALVIEGRCLNGDQARDSERLSRLTEAARLTYLLGCDSGCETRKWKPAGSTKLVSLEEPPYHDIERGPFVLVVDQRFCGLLASYRLESESGGQTPTYEMIWTFDPNVVFTAIEYLMARIGAQMPGERDRFDAALGQSTPRSFSLRLALTLTTKLTMLMQRQNELEIAINRVGSAISNTLEIESFLQAAVDEVGEVLDARRSALVLWKEGTSLPESMTVYERPEFDGGQENQRYSSHQNRADHGAGDEGEMPAPIEAPITYRNSVIGVLVVEDDRPGRIWEDEEKLMVNTVSDQLAVAISHARLFRHVQTQAITDSLTGLFNHRYFQERLDREIKLSDRTNTYLSLILLDLDHLKRINDTMGHRAGDAALLHVARKMTESVRDIDICARYGGEEFVVILPRCGRDDALSVAERLRESIAAEQVERLGQVTGSLGVATYPSSARNKEELIEMADRAMYLAKAAGRNRVRTLMHRTYSGRIDEMV